MLHTQYIQKAYVCVCERNVKNIFNNPTHQLHHQPTSLFPLHPFSQIEKENGGCFSFTTFHSSDHSQNVEHCFQCRKEEDGLVYIGCVSWNELVESYSFLFCFTWEQTQRASDRMRAKSYNQPYIMSVQSLGVNEKFVYERLYLYTYVIQEKTLLIPAQSFKDTHKNRVCMYIQNSVNVSSIFR